MLHEELKEHLKDLDSTLETIKQFWQHSTYDADFARLEAIVKGENFWQNPNQGMILKEYQAVKSIAESYKYITTNHIELNELVDLFAQDEQELQNIKTSIDQHRKELKTFKISLLLSDEHDNENCFLTINAGAGGTESQDWSEMLLRMYARFCERERLNATILDIQKGEGAGIKSATLFIKGKYPYGLLKSEHGIHRLVRISPFDANKRRHTSFSGVFVIPEAPEVHIEIDPEDLRIDTYRAGGAGGQHVNKTDSAVRITHLPTNIVVQCQNERSQTQNKETAMRMLKAKLVQKAEEEKRANVAAIEKKSIEWGSQIRSYVLHPYRLVKDHRTDFESGQPDNVLDGDLMEFIEQYLIWHSQQKKA
ncbi:MAG: Peptide chain release factor 2 [candidate division TM6 bacterium GW2011_GWE2_41_16]|nr:MAG: Peptide chain release factor 2 [candidate division TM6 bacterium GW2011_GWE2_41_16]